MKTKAEIISDAFSMLLMTGITVEATPEDAFLAYNRLKDLMAELESRNLQTGFTTLDDDINAPSGLQPWMNYAISSALALRICSDFGVLPSPALTQLSSSAMNNLSSRLARVNEIQYPSRMPVGSGQRWLGRFRDHYGQAAQYPNTAATQSAVQYSSGQYKIDFSPYLKPDEAITGFTQTATSGINVLSASFDGNIVSLEIQFQASVVGQVNIVATGDMGTVVPRTLDFNINNQQQIGVV